MPIELLTPEIAAQFPELAQSIDSMITTLKIIGGILGVYVLLWIVNFAYSIRRTLLIKKMIKKLEEMEIKIDKLTGSKK